MLYDVSNATGLRGLFEEEYGDDVLSHDVIETIVSNFQITAQANGYDIADIVDNAYTLTKTLRWSSAYNRNPS